MKRRCWKVPDRLNPVLVVFDMSLSGGNLRVLMKHVGVRAPRAKVLLLSVHDERTVADSAFAAGADAVVLKRCLATTAPDACRSIRVGVFFFLVRQEIFFVHRK